MKTTENKYSLDYDTWIKLVNQEIGNQLGGMDTQDCPDICNTHQWWNDGMSYKAAAKKFVKAQLKEAGF